MSASAAASPADRALPIWRDPAAWLTVADVFAGLIALALPWSTTLVAIFAAAWLVTLAPALDIRALLQSLKRPICVLPMAIVALALLGTLWSDAAWGERLYAVGPTLKLLALPLLLYHYERSSRGLWVLAAFLVSCVLLMAMSWIVAYQPGLALKTGADYGIPVKNYIDQSQEFALCALVLLYPIATLARARRFWPALLLAMVALGFVANMVFVIVSRTALVTMPVMLLVFALLHLRWRNVILIACTISALAGTVWLLSPHLRATTATFVSDYQRYKESGRATSIGMRLEFFKKSLRFFAEAPIAGHGTGSTRGLFEQAATVTGPGYNAGIQVVANPHNQTLNVAVQWGVIGVVLLYAMWLYHLALFRGEGLAASIGVLVVVQNILTSLFNSHLFDFNEGWMYVLGVGIAGGMMLKAKREGAASQTPGPAL